MLRSLKYMRQTITAL